MFEQLMGYPEDNVLGAKLTKRGSKVAYKRLAKEKKGTYPKTGTPADFYSWWLQYKEGKKKDKIAMCIMAYHYPKLVMHLDQCQSKILQLEDKTESQEEEIRSLKQKLLQQEAKNTLLTENMCEISTNMLNHKSQTEKKITVLKQKLLQQEEENTLLTENMCEISTNMLNHKSQTEKKITVLKQKLLQQEEENTLLTENMCEISTNMLNHKSQTEKKITVLKQKLLQQEEENEQLKDKISNYNTTVDAFQNSLRLPVPVTGGLQRSHHSLLADLPNLQYDHSNYEFWMKIKKWLYNGEMAPQCVFKLVQIKCPHKAWQVIADKFENNDLTEMAFSNPANAGRLLDKLWKCVSEALGPGTKLFEVYYQRRQEVGETFEKYIQEKFKLYCSYGVDNPEPDRNDPHFLHNVIENAEKSYQSLESLCPKSYAELLTRGMLINKMLTTAAWNNKCFNCNRKGHTQDQCRRPGGDAEVGPYQCYTCGGYGHWARECWT